ncbi:hypothetical protein J6590_034746 [Homalodisca vitripennis]|nr:hypothetical protein J6590_034746 [Homalodisca vitripennis]
MPYEPFAGSTREVLAGNASPVRVPVHHRRASAYYTNLETHLQPSPPRMTNAKMKRPYSDFFLGRPTIVNEVLRDTDNLGLVIFVSCSVGRPKELMTLWHYKTRLVADLDPARDNVYVTTIARARAGARVGPDATRRDTAMCSGRNVT